MGAGASLRGGAIVFKKENKKWVIAMNLKALGPY